MRKKECIRGDDAEMSVKKRLNDISPPNVVVGQRNLPVFELCDIQRGRRKVYYLMIGESLCPPWTL